MDDLFYVYRNLYPGQENIIIDAIKKGIEKADILNITGKERIDEISSHILDALD